jgi:hypothetical protein
LVFQRFGVAYHLHPVGRNCSLFIGLFIAGCGAKLAEHHNLLRNRAGRADSAGKPASGAGFFQHRYDLVAVRSFVQRMRQTLDALALNPEHRGEAEAELGTVESQIGSPKPKSSIIREG